DFEQRNFLSPFYRKPKLKTNSWRLNRLLRLAKIFAVTATTITVGTAATAKTTIILNNNNNNHNNNSHPAEQACPQMRTATSDPPTRLERGGQRMEKASSPDHYHRASMLARASRSLCEDSQAAAAGMDLSGAIGVGGAGSVTSTGGGVGGVGIGVGADGSSPPLQGEVNVTLWQFLLELLMSRQYSHVIQWTNREGEFQLLRAEEVARLWGMRKNKNHRMNYDKLSRALRYYYQKNIIKKRTEGAEVTWHAAAAAAAASSIATPSDGVSPKLEAVDDDLPASPQLEEPQAAIPVPLLQKQPQPPQQLQHQPTESLTPPPQPAVLTTSPGGVAASSYPAASAAAPRPRSQSARTRLQQRSLASVVSSVNPPQPQPLALSKRLRSPNPPPPPLPPPDRRSLRRPSGPAALAAATSRPVTRQLGAATAASAADSPESGSSGGGGLPSSYIQWLTLELAGGAAAAAGGSGRRRRRQRRRPPAFLHSSRHAANMKKLAEHIRLQKLFKRPSLTPTQPHQPPPTHQSADPVAAAAASPSASSHGLSHQQPAPPHAAAAGLTAASSSYASNGSPFSPPGCVWMPVPVAMLSQLWAGQEAPPPRGRRLRSRRRCSRGRGRSLFNLRWRPGGESEGQRRINGGTPPVKRYSLWVVDIVDTRAARAVFWGAVDGASTSAPVSMGTSASGATTACERGDKTWKRVYKLL
uniref:ETS domain-containing protein n=1 Tax=Macrostomum lignano TaxID=282301 RepID=A0A1I8JN23_9PLAT